MKTKIQVGLSRKIGQPNYGSCGASCHVEFELDLAPSKGSTAKFQQAVERTFGHCREAVLQELLKNGTTATSSGLRQATRRQVAAIRAIGRRLHVDLELMLARYEAATPEELSVKNASELIDYLNSLKQVRDSSESDHPQPITKLDTTIGRTS